MLEKPLEQLAKQAFQNYAHKQTGNRHNWHYLSSDRQLEWMTEMADKYLLALQTVKKDLSLSVAPQPGMASYDRGIATGIAQEAMRLSLQIEVIETVIQDELQKFSDRMDKK